MKITKITIKNYLGASSVEMNLCSPVTIVAGRNGSGKSSVNDAIRHALTGETVRVNLKKDYGDLVTDGQESGFVEVATADANYSVVLPSGKGIHCDNATLPFVLDAQRFSHISPNERRSFLFGLMGLLTDSATVKDRLTVRGCDAKKVEQIATFLRAGFDAAQKEAAGKARDSKASWKTATGGETWGKDKAPKWKPTPLPHDADRAAARYENAVTKRNEVNSELAKAHQDLGAIKAEQRRQNEAEARRLELHEQASKIDRIQHKLKIDIESLSEWEEKVDTTRKKAGATPVNTKAQGEFLLRGLARVTDDFLTIANNNPGQFDESLINRASTHLAEYKKLHGWPHSSQEQIATEAAAKAEAVSKLPEYENALALLQRSVANGKRDLEAAQRAAEQLKELDGLKANADTSAAEAKVAELTEKRNGWQADADKYREIADKYSRRQDLIEQVAKLHQDVLDWTHIADALAPDGIPGELLAEVLGPINERLHDSAGIAEWEQVVIHSDMRITYGLRDYALISESEKWRTDAMIAEAVSFLAGVKLLVLDRFDVLDLKGREDLLYWLDGMATDGEIETALVFGTLKALPAINFSTIAAHWIDNGAAGQIKEAA